MIVTGIIILALGALFAVINIGASMGQTMKQGFESDDFGFGPMFIRHALASAICIIGFTILAIGIVKEVT